MYRYLYLSPSLSPSLSSCRNKLQWNWKQPLSHNTLSFRFIYNFLCRLLQLQICCCCCCQVVAVASCTLQKYFHNFYHDCNSCPKSFAFKKFRIWATLLRVASQRREAGRGRKEGKGEKASGKACQKTFHADNELTTDFWVNFPSFRQQRQQLFCRQITITICTLWMFVRALIARTVCAA